MQILGKIGSDGPWFSPGSFAQPTVSGQFGNTSRNIFDGPGFFSLDASLLKTLSFKERYSLELRGEAFGITNTPAFANPNNTVGNANFGFVTGTLGTGTSSTGGGNRTVQLGAKFTF